MEDNKQRQVVYSAQVSSEFKRIYLYGEITEPEDYIDVIESIIGCSENDLVRIHLNTPGGNLMAALAIINAMSECQAHIITSIEGECNSAGTLIFLAGDEFDIDPNCRFMIHTYFTGTYGKGNEIASNIKFSSDWWAKIVRRFYLGFLSEQEIEEVINGKDMWMDAEEVSLRCSYMLENASKNSTIDCDAE